MAALHGMNGCQLAPVSELCQERNISFPDYSNGPKYVRSDEYSKDGNHMNSRGTDEFTRNLVAALDQSISD